MVRMVPIQQASAQLAELVHALTPGDEIVLTEGARRVGRILPEPVTRPPRRPGSCKGMMTIVDDDDAAILEQFSDYLP